ncbi:hypothetical protein [Bradyrhizobium sp. Ash2021]|uniref:hypothetical protein n=1 Tax=Bradyrhizobium sp. Ash2021 TaxID=2954771 RepID=UPI00281542F4|nr:hypothetical protein [Bradyrhizobium sp. Ash2021]WMT70957.1 hypothetical protein NL528_22835 [Bradyrhizobium sp. Ash2021]
MNKHDPEFKAVQPTRAELAWYITLAERPINHNPGEPIAARLTKAAAELAEKLNETKD